MRSLYNHHFLRPIHAHSVDRFCANCGHLHCRFYNYAFNQEQTYEQPKTMISKSRKHSTIRSQQHGLSEPGSWFSLEKN